jgi:hypothetical protein
MILKKFGPHNKDDSFPQWSPLKDWDGFAEWAGLDHCKEYYSLDGLIRSRMFNPESIEDWQNCINEDFKIDIITNLDYAKKIIHKYPGSEIVGCIEDPRKNNSKILKSHILLGYDILDDHNDVSLLTNWGGKDCTENIQLNAFALVDKSETAYSWASKLRKDHADDPHACNCKVWAVFKVKY